MSGIQQKEAVEEGQNACTEDLRGDRAGLRHLLDAVLHDDDYIPIHHRRGKREL